jgi:hypothetical protein
MGSVFITDEENFLSSSKENGVLTMLGTSRIVGSYPSYNIQSDR